MQNKQNPLGKEDKMLKREGGLLAMSE